MQRIKKLGIFALLLFLISAVWIGPVALRSFTTATVESGAIYYPDPNEPDQGAVGAGKTIYSFNSLAGPDRQIVIKLRHKGINDKTYYYVDTDLTTNKNVTLEIEPGAILADAGNETLTIYSPENIIAGDSQQIFNFDGSGGVSFTVAGVLCADWFGDHTYAAVDAAYDAAAEGSTIKLSGGTWTFGTNQLDLIGKAVTLKGASSSIDPGDSIKATMISHTGVDSAVRINIGTNVEDLGITGGVYGLTLGNDSGAGAVNWTGVVRNVFVTLASTAGVNCYGVQVGYVEKLWSMYNTGAGMLITGADTNTNGIFVNCRFYSNDEEGVLYSTNSQFEYYGCHFESNGYEGVKNLDSALTRTKFIGGWVENNNSDAGHAAGYYNFLFSNTSNADITLRNVEFNGASTANNGHIYFKGTLRLAGGNEFGGTCLATGFVAYGGSGTTLFNMSQDVSLDSGHVAFSDQANRYMAAIPEFLRDSKNVLLGGSYNNIPRLHNVTIINDSGAVVSYNLPDVGSDMRIGFASISNHTITLSPKTADQIIPLTDAVNADIVSAGLAGEFIELTGDPGGVLWNVTQKVGIWNGPSGDPIRALADEATPSVLGWDKWVTSGTDNDPITDFDDGVEGQVITLMADHTVVIDVDAGNIFLNGAVDFTMNANDTLTLICKADNKWYEIGRSDNS